ncbi:hypothetical protein ACFL5P_01235 [candidate division KSB1 bacterium]
MKKARNNKLIAFEKTPAVYNCVAYACPSVFETNRGTYIIVGKKVNMKEIAQDIKNKIGAGEAGIEVPKGLITELIS